MSLVEFIVSEVNPSRSVDTGQVVPSVELEEGREVSGKAGEGGVVVSSVTASYFSIGVFDPDGETTLHHENPLTSRVSEAS